MSIGHSAANAVERAFYASAARLDWEVNMTIIPKVAVTAPAVHAPAVHAIIRANLCYPPSIPGVSV